jgi:UDP-glucose 4-epimerase
MPLNPPDLKSLSKKFNEEMAHYYSSRYGINAIGMRPLNVYGNEEFSKGPFANTVSLFVWAILCGHQPVIWGDGSQTRDFIYVDDVARVFQLALESNLGTQEFNVGTGIETRIIDVIPIIQRVVGNYTLAPIYFPVPIDIYAERLVANMDHSEKVLGFRAEINLEEGIKKVVHRALEYLKDKPVYGELQYYVMSQMRLANEKNAEKTFLLNAPLLNAIKGLERTTR